MANQWRIQDFSDEGADPKTGGSNCRLANFSPKNFMKTKEIGPKLIRQCKPNNKDEATEGLDMQEYRLRKKEPSYPILSYPNNDHVKFIFLRFGVIVGLPDEFWILTSVGRGDRSSSYEWGNAEVCPEIPEVCSASWDWWTRLQDTGDDDGRSILLFHWVRCISVYTYFSFLIGSNHFIVTM